jgi:hypothetical protein
MPRRSRNKKSAEALEPFESIPVIGTSIKITKAGDGLSKSLAIAPSVLHTGDEVFVLLKCEVGPIRMVPVKDADAYTREQTLVAGTATMVAADWASEAIAWQEDQIQRHADSMKGQGRLDDPAAHVLNRDPMGLTDEGAIAMNAAKGGDASVWEGVDAHVAHPWIDDGSGEGVCAICGDGFENSLHPTPDA